MKLSKLQRLALILLGGLLTSLATAQSPSPLVSGSKPNIIVLFADDLGYGDLTCYGGKKVKSPNIDRLAEEGMRFTDFLIPANVCGPSRASLLTGRYPMRNGNPVFQGLDPKEITFPELLKEAGYTTSLIGKWHLGAHLDGAHPLDAGFDESLMMEKKVLTRGRDEVIMDPTDFSQLTQIYTKEAIKFIEREKDGPFMLYLAHHIPHLPLAPHPRFKKQSKLGVYADCILELDDSTGRILQALKDNGIDDNTLVVFTSDNGAAARGSTGPLAGSKYITMEGGHRVPGIFRWPGRIPAGTVSDTMVGSMDFFPLFCELAGVALPTDRVIDGRNIADILTGHSTESPHAYFYYYNGRNLQCIRQGKWKLHLPRERSDMPFWGGRLMAKQVLKEPKLFNLDADIGETHNVAADYPEVLDALLKKADEVRAELGDVDVEGSDMNPQSLLPPRS
ncbi:sulfatase [Coraliomargarita algicola]|uniref:Sulfatase n=1 Tax=Coraliomargarita algicola TaxID=3092156 RepID=A0ABZ0RQ39_9BACT|nr:sulfatase [Coraliomargarita sp. J2-16]WPJ97012.1 sulfatase [Coraliomargarita sp. J2-16]